MPRSQDLLLCAKDLFVEDMTKKTAAFKSDIPWHSQKRVSCARFGSQTSRSEA